MFLECNLILVLKKMNRLKFWNINLSDTKTKFKKSFLNVDGLRNWEENTKYLISYC